ncbi:MAG: hypothetical protein IJZ35_05050 [Clostridia bacterium]|nr:hypothetical protein [Clostridia bacterium]
MKRKKLLTAAVCLIAISALVITCAAAAIYKYNSATGAEEQLIARRVNITVSQTEFTYSGAEADGMLSCTTTVSIEKTEPDFYGMLHSITLSGAEFGYTLYTADQNNGDAILPEEVALPSDENGTYPLEWDISFTVPYEEGKNVYEIDLIFNYTTGLKPNTTQRYQTSIPLTLTVEE